MRFVTISCLLILVFAIHVPSFGAGGWSCLPDSTLPVVTERGNQWNARMASDGMHGAIMVWQDRRDGISDKLYVQRISSLGETLWSDGGIQVSTTQGYQYYPQVMSDGVGGAYIVWQDNRASSDYDIYIQRITASGEKLFGETGVAVCSAGGHQYYPRLVGGLEGEVIVVWQDKRPGSFDIYAQSVNQFGQTRWMQNGIPVSSAPSDQLDPQISPDGLGGAIITWSDFRGLTGFSDIYAQRITRSGGFAWPAAGVQICAAENTQWNPQITPDGLGGAHIAWQDRRNSFYDLVYAQRIDALGNIRWTGDGIAVTNATGNQYYPRIAGDGLGGVLIAWQDNRGSSDFNIYAQRINPAGQLVWSRAGRLVTNATDHQYYPQIIRQGASFMVTWQDRRNGTYDIYAQRFNLSGETHWPDNGIVISNAPFDQYMPAIVSDSLEGAIICWSDFKMGDGSTDIFAHRVGANGMLAGGCFRTFSQDSLNKRRIRISRRKVGMPNQGNVRDSIFGRGAYSQGLVIGVEKYDSSKLYGWVYYKKSFYARRALPQNGQARGLDRRYDKLLTGILRNPSNKRYNNALVGELVTLKLNIAASDVRITPEHLGDLLYHDEENTSDLLNGLTLREISTRVDSMLTFWRWYQGLDYTKLFLTIRKINRAFIGPIDTVTLRPLRVTPVRSLFSVPFLAPNTEPPVEVPQYVPLALIPEEEYGYQLAQNFPNPFNPLTTIEFILAYPSVVSMKVYDITGREVANLIGPGEMEEGFHAVDFDAAELASGIYFYRILASPLEDGIKNFTVVRKMILMK